jgi:hypothetical protein
LGLLHVLLFAAAGNDGQRRRNQETLYCALHCRSAPRN